MKWNRMLKQTSIWGVWLVPQVAEIFIINYCKLNHVNPSKYLHHAVDPQEVQTRLYDYFDKKEFKYVKFS